MRPIKPIGRVDSLHHTWRVGLACVVLCGCLDEAPSNTQPTTARERWTMQAWPALGACVGCHATQPAIDFLAPGTADGAYTTLFEFQPPVIDVSAPASSLLLTMGKHTGPAFVADAASTIIAWLEAERDERIPDMGASVRVGPFKPTLGAPMTLELGVAGATMTILPEASEAGLYLSRLSVNAGSGLRLAHPLFVSRPPQPVLDELDRFSELDVKLAAGATLDLGPVLFLSFEPTEYLSVHFKNLEAP